ncbi:MAG: 3-deoxy-D-manno-octulosonic acid transferase [Candidatus Omnitrophica bacterium]|nr:3-deoxy-D-manno-octulosonic acid transferase [Candidatus Omnitrophota bacterium]
MMLYDIGFAIFSVFYLPTLIFKGKLHADFLERFGVYTEAKRAALEKAKNAVWIQAVSVGEVALCRSLVPLIKERFPDNPIIFSTITKTGNELARKLFAKDAVIIYFPLDFSFVVKKVIRLIRPKLFVMVETEIWPNFLKTIERNAIPAVLINGRISDRSFGKYEMARPFLCKIVKGINSLCMQSKTDADRIIKMGAVPEKVKVTGNMKFDVRVKPAQVSGGDTRKQLDLREPDELLVAGSTHPGEEEALVAAYRALVKKFPGLKLLIAPRHIERADEVAEIIREAGFEPVRLSGSRPIAPGALQVFVLDTIGRLNDFYSIASVVFIGGSLVKHGGQNPIEPAVYGKPVLFGPYMFNFKNIAEAFLAKDAAIRVGSRGDLTPVLYNILADKDRRARIGACAKEVVSANRGATERVLNEMARFL